MKKIKKQQKLYKELFDTVYQWGKVGIVTDENCNTFQDLIHKIEKEAKNPIKNY